MLWGNVQPENGLAPTVEVVVEPHCGEPTHEPRPAFGSIQRLNAIATVVDTIPPQIPAIANEAGVDGTVIIAALVCEHGNVVDERMRKSIPMLDGAARSCVAQWKFRPALIDGKPVASWQDIQVRFVLHGPRPKPHVIIN